MTFKTIEQKSSRDEFAKARELIEIRGTGGLSLQDRRVMNVLYANAGNQLCDEVTHVIGIAEIGGTHRGGERVKDSILRLMKTIVEMQTKDAKGNPAIQLVPILSDTPSATTIATRRGRSSIASPKGCAASSRIRRCGAECEAP